MLETVSFYLFAGILLLSALLAVTLRHPVYSVLSFLASMFSLAILFWLLKAYFVAVIQITIYAGAILVLFLFVLMLVGYVKEPPALRTNPIRFAFAVGFATLSLAGLLWIFRLVGGVGRELYSRPSVVGSTAPSQLAAPSQLGEIAGTIESVGRVLFSVYLLPFELLSVVLLVAIIGSVVLGKKEL